MGGDLWHRGNTLPIKVQVMTSVTSSATLPVRAPRATAARPRHLTLVDLLLCGVGQALAVNQVTPVARRPRPQPDPGPLCVAAGAEGSSGCAVLPDTVQADAGSSSPEARQAPELTQAQRRHAAGLMRVNHVGEVCAQALYHAQAAGTADPALRDFFIQSAAEEGDHLAWTRQRLDELQAPPSVLNPLWYAGAYALGLLAARAGDSRSLGFTVETERQVEEHLAGHLDRLPEPDTASRVIVAAMKTDEAAHGQAARRLGAVELPFAAKRAMRLAARVMTTTAYRI